VRLPLLGELKLPAKEQLGYLAGVGALAAIGMVEWPVAAVLGLGHILAAERNHKILADFGEALEEA
jgi:hypothetical protein